MDRKRLNYLFFDRQNYVEKKWKRYLTKARWIFSLNKVNCVQFFVHVTTLNISNGSNMAPRIFEFFTVHGLLSIFPMIVELLFNLAGHLLMLLVSFPRSPPVLNIVLSSAQVSWLLHWMSIPDWVGDNTLRCILHCKIR